MRNLVHRHEPPVLSTPIQIVAETSEYIAVNKPASIPVHVAGQYRKNTVLGILNAERPDLGTLHPVHRLDKPVSGVLIFARNAVAADILRLGIADKGAISKIYIARVLGKFPATVAEAELALKSTKDGERKEEEESRNRLRNNNEPGEVIVADVALSWDSRSNHAMAVLKEERNGGEIQGTTQGTTQPGGTANGTDLSEAKQIESSPSIKAPIDSEINAKDGGESSEGPIKKRKHSEITKAERKAAYLALCKNSSSCGPQVRPAATEFRLLGISPDGKTSLVECRPRTGRSHQIRAHLAYLGHPIANDHQYGGIYDGPSSCRALAKDMGVLWGAGRGGTGGFGIVHSPENGNMSNPSKIPAQEVLKEANAQAEEALDMAKLCPNFEAPAECHDPHCPHCPLYGPRDYPNDLRALWLHARKYKGPEWTFEAPVPDWADLGLIPEVPVERVPVAADAPIEN